MNVLLRFLKIIGIAVLIILNENQPALQSRFGVPGHLSGGIIGFLLFLLIAEISKDVLLYLYRRRKGMQVGQTDNVTVGLDNIYFLILGGAFTYFVLHLLKLKPKDFFTGFTLISAAVAVIMKDYVSNIISGMILAFSDKLKIGDYVQLGHHTGEIIDFSLTMITMRNDDDELVYIPINMIYANDLINYSATTQDSITIAFDINHKMKMPLEELEERIQKCMEEYQSQIVANSEKLIVSSVNQDTTTFKYSFTLRQRNLVIAREIKSKVLRQVFEMTKINAIPL